MGPCLSHRRIHWTMSVDNAHLILRLLGNLNLMDHSDIFFFRGINWSGYGTTSTANHRFYKALGRLHGPWCKQPPKLRFVNGTPSKA